MRQTLDNNLKKGGSKEVHASSGFEGGVKACVMGRKRETVTDIGNSMTEGLEPRAVAGGKGSNNER